MDDATGLRWCAKCQVLLRDVTPAACGAGGYHDTATSGHYYLVTGAADSVRDGGWRACRFCRALFHQADSVAASSAPIPSVAAMSASAPVNPSLDPPSSAMAAGAAHGRLCPAVGGDGAHADDGVEYAVRVDSGDVEQIGWRRCVKCWALFYGGGGDDNGTCPVDRRAHAADGRHLVVEFERLATFPWPRAIGEGKEVELNYEAPGDVWSGAGIGRWYRCTPTELWAESEGGAGAWRVHLTMIHGPKVWVQMGISVHTTFLPFAKDGWLSSGFNSPPAVPCYNDSSFDATDGQVEWDNGKNNNGVELTLQGGVMVVRMWPKREDRIRFDLQRFVPATADEKKDFDQHKRDHPTEVWHRDDHLELDTRE
jgi:hypothetical protein